MQLTLSGFSALRVIRAMRVGLLGRGKARRCNLFDPIPPGKRWTKPALQRALEPVAAAIDFPGDDPLEICVRDPAMRIRSRGVKCTVHAAGLPDNAFITPVDGIAISCPELIIVELANRLTMPELLLVAMELCGGYTLSPDGDVSFEGAPPVTTSARIHAFLRRSRHLWGQTNATTAHQYMLDNAWSPMEAVLAIMLALPFEEFGYGLGPLVLNRRETREGAPTERGSRVPDILFPGTGVGLNYDGEGHFGMVEIANAGKTMVENPDSDEARLAFSKAVRDARQAIVGDKRRDRDLSVMGLTVLPVTKEDLYEADALDRLALQLIELMEMSGARRLETERRMLASRILRKGRRLMLRALLPGKEALAAREGLRRLMEPPANASVREVRFAYVRVADGMRVEWLG